ncbi:MAG TPA: YihY/virulence factor BrkB family protein [Gemmatimonadaceae bacterium]|nr:YihY/virulence factor BrkB family protein [Gemmatimonadaceae bacterium]
MCGARRRADGYNCAVDPLTPVRALDRLQRRRAALGFPIGVLKKFSDDHAGNLAALMAWYGFFALFPLLLVLVTVLGYVLRGNPDVYDDIVRSAVAQFPVIGRDLEVNALGGSTVALVIGLAGAIWAGLGITLAGQRAMDRVWDVPHRLRRNFLTARLRGLLTLLVLGLLNVAVTTAVGLLAGGRGGTVLKAAGFPASVLLDVALFWAVFRLFTSDAVPTRQLWPGIVLASVGWAALQALAGIYVDQVVAPRNQTYGFFAIVLGLLTWLYVGAQMLLYAAEANVVRARRLWPRSLMEPVTDADMQALRAAARVEERRDGERIEVTFDSRE